MSKLSVGVLLLIGASSAAFVAVRVGGPHANTHLSLGTTDVQAAQGEPRAVPISWPPPAAQADPFASAPFPFEATLSDLRGRLGLTEDQSARLRSLYERQWEATKNAVRSGRVGPEVANDALEADARGFLSDDQMKKFVDYRADKEAQARVDGHKVADASAHQYQAPLGLSDAQEQKMAQAFYELYTGPWKTGDTISERMDEKTRSILSADQRNRLKAMLSGNMQGGGPKSM